MTLYRDIVQEVLNESSLTRVEKWLNEKDIATITAFRGKLTNVTDKTLIDKELESEYSKRENKSRNRKLRAILLSYGYGVTNISGVYVENFGSKDAKPNNEDSFLVVNLNDDSDFFKNLAKVSEYFNQDSFLYKSKDKEQAELVGTNKADFPGYGEHITVGSFIPNVAGEFMSRIGNTGFVFGDESTSVDRDNPHSTFQDRKKDRIAESLDQFSKYSNNSKWIIKNLSKDFKEKFDD